MTRATGSRPRRLDVLALLLAWPLAAHAEVVDQSVSISATAALSELMAVAAALPVENRNPVAVTSGDVDGDTDLDVLVLHRLPEEPPLLLLNDGQGNFTDVGTTQLPVLTEGETLTGAVSDLDGDGDLDAYVGRSSGDLVWMNDGFGTFSDETAAWLPAGWGGTQAVVAGQLTGDGLPEVITIQQGGALRVLEPTGHSLRDVTAYAFDEPPADLAHVALADLDGDGDADIAAAGADQLVLYENDGVRCRRAHQWPNPSGEPVTGLVIADLDADGVPEIVVGRHGRPIVLARHGRQPWRVQVGRLRVRGLANSVAIADLDGDGSNDVLLSMTGPDCVLLNPRSAQAWYPAANWLPDDNEATRGAVVGDFTGDGQADIYLANDGQDRLIRARDTSAVPVPP